MGYWSVNKATIERKYDNPRKLIAKVYCDERDKWIEKEFGFN